MAAGDGGSADPLAGLKIEAIKLSTGGAAAASPGLTSTSNLSPIDLNERFNDAAGVTSVFTPSPATQRYQTVNPPPSEPGDIPSPFSTILGPRSHAKPQDQGGEAQEEAQDEEAKEGVAHPHPPPHPHHQQLQQHASPNYRYQKSQGSDEEE